MRALWFDTPLGAMVALGDSRALSGLHFSGARHLPDVSACEDGRDCLLLRRVSQRINAYFNGHRGAFDIPLDAPGTPLQQAVWQALAEIPLGSTISYSELATRVGRPRAVRAVAQAVGRNPWTIIRPCHRVVGSDGSLTGFAGGLERKSALLAHEARLAREAGVVDSMCARSSGEGAEVMQMSSARRPASSG